VRFAVQHDLDNWIDNLSMLQTTTLHDVFLDTKMQFGMVIEATFMLKAEHGSTGAFVVDCRPPYLHRWSPEYLHDSLAWHILSTRR
jgi:hypothetical protein